MTRSTVTTRRLPAIVLLTAGAMLLSACTMLQRNRVSVDYYAISGNSTTALDREIRRKGPRISDGRHAVAVARIRMIPRLDYGGPAGACGVRRAKVVVDAKVTLPRLVNRRAASAHVSKAWDNIDRYTRLHEAMHVAIAFRYAKQMEAAALALPAKDDCRSARTAAMAVLSELLERHDAAQRKFDADEQARFDRLASGRPGRRGS